MLLPGVLGFHGILVFCLLVFGLVIRQKWRDAAVRKLEVTNLLNAVAEESLMVESEAASQYNCMPGFYQCAVCFLPTTTRCSRCKAVRYWSVNYLAFFFFEGEVQRQSNLFLCFWISKFVDWKFLFYVLRIVKLGKQKLLYYD